MKRLLRFIKTTAIGGLLVIIPLAIVLFVLGKVFAGLYGLAAGLIGSELVQGLELGISEAFTITATALGALVGLCFATGLIVRTRLGQALSEWAARNIAPKIPMYRALTNLTKRFVGVEGTEFSPVEVDRYGTAARSLGFLVEELPDDRCIVFVPAAPVATVGEILVVPRTAVTGLDASVTEAATVISQWGVDAGTLYRKRPGPG